MSIQQSIDGDAQTTLGYWSRFEATVLTQCPICGAPVAKRGVSRHIASPDCEPAEAEREASPFGEVPAR